MARSSFVGAVRELLEPALAERGFGPGGPGLTPDGAVTFLFCTGAAEFTARWPTTADAMRSRTQVDDNVTGACLDLTIEVSRTGDICRADLEFVDLDKLLLALGHGEMARRCSPDALQQLDPTAVALQIRAAVEVLMPLQ